MPKTDTQFKKGHKKNIGNTFAKGKNLGNTNGFKKGVTAWNKGTKNPATSLLFKGKKLSDAHRKKLSDSHKGKPTGRTGALSNLWKGGVTPIHLAIRMSLEYRLWREAVFKRDNFTCVWCGDKNYEGRGKTLILHADHIKPFYLFPELRYSIDNGRTLCVPCHKTTDTWGRPKKHG